VLRVGFLHGTDEAGKGLVRPCEDMNDDLLNLGLVRFNNVSFTDLGTGCALGVFLGNR
jgi:hypothetical protein